MILTLLPAFSNVSLKSVSALTIDDRPIVQRRISIYKSRYIRTFSIYRTVRNKLKRRLSSNTRRRYRRYYYTYRRRIVDYRKRIVHYRNLYYSLDEQNKKDLGVFCEDPNDLDDIENATDHHFNVFLTYQCILEDFNEELANKLWDKGTYLQLAWEPRNPSHDSVNQPNYSLSTIIDGNHDAAIRKWAQQIKDFGHPIYFRPMCEMNGNWTSWSGTVNGNSPEEYRQAWIHIYNIFSEEEAADQIYWVWAPNRSGDYVDALNVFYTYYPGDIYVDYMGINGYNWGTMYDTPEWTSEWQDFSEIFKYSYTVFTEQTDKSVVICESASTEQGGNKALWIKNTLQKLLTSYSKIKFYTWFNIDKETDWRIDSSSASLTSFKNYAKYHE